MEPGFIKASSSNIPKIDVLMLGMFLGSNSDFCSAEFRNVKTSKSSRPSYGDDAISYVQLKREGKICTVRCKICPEHKVHAKLYAVTLIVDEEEEKIISVQCHDCIASQGGCKHAVAFLMWLHRRSEEPSCTSVECYWRKSKLANIGTSLKYVKTKDLSKGCPSLPSKKEGLKKFLEEGRNRGITNCEILKYQHDYIPDEMLSVSMHHLVAKFTEKCPNKFLETVSIADTTINKIIDATRDQHKSSLWYELRYGRITASKAYEVSRCTTNDGTLVSLIMGGKIPDTLPMKRGRTLEETVRQTVEIKLNQKINKFGLMLSKTYPMLAGSPDGICQDGIIEIKCPSSLKTYSSFVKNREPTEKFYCQMQMQMYLTGKKKCFYCVADPEYSTNNKVDIFCVLYDNEYVINLIPTLIEFWKLNIYPLLYKSIEDK